MTISPSREQVMSALLALLQNNVIGITTYSRTVTLPARVHQDNLPALMLYRLREKWENPGLGMPPKRTWSVWIIVVFQNQDKSIAGDTILNPILDGIESALRPTALSQMGVQNLGGLVQSCRIDGEIHLEPGDTDANGIGGAVIPVTVIVP